MRVTSRTDKPLVDVVPAVRRFAAVALLAFSVGCGTVGAVGPSDKGADAVPARDAGATEAQVTLNAPGLL